MKVFLYPGVTWTFSTFSYPEVVLGRPDHRQEPAAVAYGLQRMVHGA